MRRLTIQYRILVSAHLPPADLAQFGWFSAVDAEPTKLLGTRFVPAYVVKCADRAHLPYLAFTISVSFIPLDSYTSVS